MPDPLKIENNKVVSTKELNFILHHLELNKDTLPLEIEIYFLNLIERIDIVFIAGLILSHRRFNTRFNVSYKGSVFRKIFEVRHYLAQYQKAYTYNWNDIFSHFKGIVKLTEADYYASESFAPIILVNGDNNAIFFEEGKTNKENGIVDLCQKYINEKVTSTNKNKEEEEYLNSRRSIISILNDSPPISVFVFTVLYNKVAPFVKSREKGYEDPSKITEQLWEFTREYIKGLHELAKNIVEHSGIGEGMITIRAYNDEGTEFQDGQKVLDTYVFDFGEIGIVPKLIEDTQKNLDLNPVYREDWEILNGAFTMRDFIRPNVTTKLNQQLYRDIAHYGLMKFYKLIGDNNGLVVSSSIGKYVERDSFPDKDDILYKEKALILGTSYFFQLPFLRVLFESSDKASSSARDLYGSPQTIESLSELINIKIINNVDELNEHKPNEKILWDIRPSVNTINNRNDEVELFKIFTKANLKVNYIAVNMKEMNLSASSLLRFLAHLNNKYTQSFILYNLDFELYDEMIENNKRFYQSIKDFETKTPYWFENKGILFYLTINGANCNFADILYGINEIEFQTINHVVGLTFPNTLSIIDNELPRNEESNIPKCLTPFFYQSSLMPFDLLLCNTVGKTLFQSNLETLLDQELIPDTFSRE